MMFQGQGFQEIKPEQDRQTHRTELTATLHVQRYLRKSIIDMLSKVYLK